MKHYIERNLSTGDDPGNLPVSKFETENSANVRALAELIGFAARLNGARSLENLLSIFMRGLGDIWPGAGVRLCEVDRRAGWLIPFDDLGADPIPIRGSLLGNTATDGESVFIEKLESHAAYIRGREAPPGLTWKSALACPLQIDSSTQYVVGVFIPASLEISKIDLTLLDRAVSLLKPLAERWKSQDAKLEAFRAIAKSIASAVDSRDPYQVGHGERVSEFAQATARIHGLETGFIDRLGLAGLLHDLGRLGIPESILLKPGSLTNDETRIVQAHPGLSVKFLQNVAYLDDVLSSIKLHHERFDGSGYPDGIEGDEIPLGARILAIADSFDAMTSPRPYRNPFTDRDALEELNANKGTQFDPVLVESFIRAHEERLIVSQNILKADDPLAELRQR